MNKIVLRSDLYTVSDIARAVGLDTQRVFQMIRANMLPVPSIKYGKRMYFDRDTAKDIVEAMGVEWREGCNI